MNNHIIIGLGGTGGRVLAAYRKLVFEKFNGNIEPDELWIRYLYVDSSASDLKMDNPEQWEIMGNSVKFDTTSVLPIPAADLASFVSNRNRFNYLAPWLGDREKWADIINDPRISTGAAGQKRRLGRLLFANAADQFNTIISHKVSELSENPDGRQVTFHVVAGLAGGTGSGSVIDVVAQLRNQYTDYENFKIMLYVLLPDENPDRSWASTDNYQPNGYSALLELNALDKGLFCPWDVGVRGREPEQLNMDKKLPFYSAYIVTEQNQENIAFNVQKVVPESMAELIFQKTIAVERDLQKEQQTKNPREFFDSAERGENPKYEDYKSPHSFKFMAYGIKRLAIPEREIKEYFGYSYSYQALCRMLYNNLSAELGYVNTKIPQTEDNSFVLSNEIKQNWYLSRDYLCLSKPVIEKHKEEKWVTIPEEFNEVDNYRVEAMNSDAIDFADKLIAIRNKARNYYNKNFRHIDEKGQNGVENFFKRKREYGLAPIADYISTTIEKGLFTKWSTGDKSISQIGDIVGTLLNFVDEERISLTQLKASAVTTIKEKEARENELLDIWEKTGIVAKAGRWTGLGNKIDKTAAEFTLAVKEKYIMETWIKGYEFADSLLSQIRSSLETMQSNINYISANISQAIKLVELEINTRCLNESEEVQSRKGLVIKYYDPEKAKNICKQSITIVESNSSRTGETRKALLKLLSADKQNFKEAKEKLTTGQILGTVSILGFSQAKQFFSESNNDHDKIQDYEQLIGVNILEKLEKDFDGNDSGLKARFEKLVKHASVMARHNPLEINDGPTIKQNSFVIVPKYKEEFQKKVVKTIIAASLNVDKSEVSIGGQQNEIVVINLEANITPRYLRSVDVLRNAHDRLYSSPQGDIARFETQLEDYEQLPSLFKKTDAELAKEEEEQKVLNATVPNLLLAKVMEILKTKKSKETGRTMLCYTPVDEDGMPDFENEVRLGSTVEKSIAKVSPEFAHLLDRLVKGKLLKDYRHIDRQAELRKAVAAEVTAVLEAYENDSENETVQIFSKAFKQVKIMITELSED